MIRTNDPVRALAFCAQATRLGLGLEVTAEGGGVYALCTRDWDAGAALWWLLETDGPRFAPRLPTMADVQEAMDQRHAMEAGGAGD